MTIEMANKVRNVLETIQQLEKDLEYLEPIQDELKKQDSTYIDVAILVSNTHICSAIERKFVIEMLNKQINQYKEKLSYSKNELYEL